MSVLREGDQDMHYSDSSHRWVAPPGVEQSLWEVGLRAHLSRHTATMGGPVAPDRLWSCRPARQPAADRAGAVPGSTVVGATVARLRTGQDKQVRPAERRQLPGAA